MNPDLLNKIADIINEKSKVFYAVVPQMKFEYMSVGTDNLRKTFCHVLNIIRLNQSLTRKRQVWNIYEVDIDKVIQNISRRDKQFADRVIRCALTPMDVEIIIRRSSFRTLSLKISPTILDF